MLATVFLVGNAIAVCGPGEDWSTPFADYGNTCDSGVCVLGYIDFTDAQGVLDLILAEEGASIWSFWQLITPYF